MYALTSNIFKEQISPSMHYLIAHNNTYFIYLFISYEIVDGGNSTNTRNPNHLPFLVDPNTNPVNPIVLSNWSSLK